MCIIQGQSLGYRQSLQAIGVVFSKSSFSDVTYTVNYGIRGSNQVMHVARIRLKRSQTLVGERDDLVESNVEKNDGDVVDVKQSKNETSVVPASNDTYSVNDERQLTDTEADLPTRQFRSRKPPVWLKDYETEY